ncbi:MAG: YqiA/YcfP family alpha/beta fold hydrolase [Desulforhopalus sp.]
MPTDILFLHGLDSSGNGTKGKFFAKEIPQIVRPDFYGPLANRLEQLDRLCQHSRSLVLIGSSFGGLMATCYAISKPQTVTRLILLAPALNFENYRPPRRKLDTPTLVVIGKHDTVTPPDLVLPLAERTFSKLCTKIADDDHLLHDTFANLDWQKMLQL